ncbi:MAG: glycosyltransferase family 87 protein [Gemmatimonadota bacterium]
MNSRGARWFESPASGRWLIALYVLAAVLVTVQQGVTGHSNNFAIFRTAWDNLRAGADLYAPHPDRHFDLYKYSPAFAVLFAPFAELPFAIGLLAWELLNALLLYYALGRLIPGRPARIAACLLLLEVIRAAQHAQSNALVAALVILAFVAFEEEKRERAALCIGVGAAIKIFPLAAGTLMLFRSGKVRFLLASAVVGIILLLLPLLVTSPALLLEQYRSWRMLEGQDALRVTAPSVMGILGTWFGIGWPNWTVQLAGTVVLVAPLARWRAFTADQSLRRLYLCSLLVYMVIFNPQAESPSYVIAMSGIMIWFASTTRSRLRDVLVVFALLLVSVASSDPTPHWFQREVVQKYALKALPCLLCWILIQRELWLGGASGQLAGQGIVHENVRHS